MPLYNKIIGIDSGTNTGYAEYDKLKQCYSCIATMPIHQAIFRVLSLRDAGEKILVVVEDARLATFGRSNTSDAHKAQGAGSVKRDAAIWQDFLKDYGIPHEMKRPTKGATKWPADYFKKVTGYTGRTSSHARDAAAMILGM